ncbi:MAG: hypothetical protein ACPKQO_03110 [Nitrososphaeraceae archaeon]
MQYRKFEKLSDFLNNLHQDGFSIIDYEGKQIPCIILENTKYQEIFNKCLGQKYIIDTVLNIFYDGTHVFVDIQLDFNPLGLEENFLIYANKFPNFFDKLEDSSLLSLLPSENRSLQNIFLIQLPNKKRISEAITIIRNNLSKSKNFDYKKIE